MSHKGKIAIAFFMVLTLVATLCLSCAEEEEGGKVTITIGEMTDLTGPGSPAVLSGHYCLEDMVRYYNEEGLVPGVEFKLISWDTKFDPSREVPGYDWLRGRGADLVISVIPQSGIILKPFADKEKFPLVSLSTDPAMLESPGWLFSPSNTTAAMMKTLLKWISENHWDYSKGVPKIGLYGWTEAATHQMEKAMEEYCQAHSDNFGWVDGFFAPMGTMTVGGEIEKLKDCNYVCVPGFPFAQFITEFRARGYEAAFIDAGVAGPYVGFFVDRCGWEVLDGLLTAQPTLWWNESTIMVNQAKEVLHRYRPEQAEEVMYAGNGYVGMWTELAATFEILQNAIAQVGAENFNNQAFYDAAVKYKTAGPLWEGHPEWGFTQTKRYLIDHIVVYEFSAEAEDLVQVSDDWLPLVLE